MEYTVSIFEDFFPGFYNTYLDPNEIEKYDEKNQLEEDGITEEEFEEITARVCDFIVETVEKETVFKVLKWKLDSPSAYNYRNDTLWLTIDTTPEIILCQFINHEYRQDLEEWIIWEDWKDDEYHEAILQQLVSNPICGLEKEIMSLVY